MGTKKDGKSKKNRAFTWYLLGLLLVGCMAFTLPNAPTVQDLFINDNLYQETIKFTAQKYNLDPNFIRAVIYKESKFNEKATGKAGEIGLMQIIPKAAVADWARINKREIPSRKELFEPVLNIEIGSWYLAEGMRRYHSCPDQKELALARYNAGATNSEKWRKATPMGQNVVNYITYPSTKKYVQTIMKKYNEYSNELEFKLRK